ncbi:MAG: response regulator [Candidatus Omnitrophica bacterium]|nr:response regulator [Candidatus Omnitrophota bacterium]
MPNNVLIVDDEKFLTDTLGAFLKSKGYNIFKAEDGQTTLNIIKNEMLDLVLLDIKLPGVDGIEILRLMRRDYPQVKVIVMTAYDMEYKQRVDDIGYDAFFLKPLLLDDLTREIERLLSGEKTATPLAEDKIKNTRQPVQGPQFTPLEGALPKARLLIVSPRNLISGLLKDYFSKREICNGIYEITESGLEQLEHIRKFQPDIVLLDIALVGMLGEFGLTLMNLPQPPKEIILFGDPAVKWEEVEALTRRGTRFIEIPSDLHDKGYPIKDTIERLDNAVKDVCIKYGLVKKEKSYEP